MDVDELIHRIAVIFILIVIVILGLIYAGLGYYYRDSFSYGTRINGIYCTGHTPDEVNTMLNDHFKYDGMTVEYDENGEHEELYISPEDIDFTFDFKPSLSIYLKSQNSWTWPANLISGRDRTLLPIVDFNNEKLDHILDGYEVFTYDISPDVHVVCEDGVYELYDTTRHRPDCTAMRRTVKNAIYSSEDRVVIDDSYYYDTEYTPEQIGIIDEYESVRSMLGARITYVFGDRKVELTDDKIVSFLTKNEDDMLVESDEYTESGTGDRYVWSSDAIDTWVDALADEYDTLGKTRTFTATGGYTVEVSGGIYGNQMDRKTEKEYVKDALIHKKKEEHTPEYIQKAISQNADDIGTTYVEVNMTDQKLYYYADGELLIDTPVVTGNMLRHMDTPSGTNYVYYKQKNRTLIGPDYQTFVHFWMAVNGHIGIHDATWRGSFGNDIYKTNGSHGCINTPMDAVSELYDLVEIGTPVIMYYLPEDDQAKPDYSEE